MSIRHRFGLVSASVLAAMIGLQSPIAQAQSKIGVAATVTSPAEVGTRPLAAGNDVHANERVRTGDAGAAQLLFIDETSLSIGPKSEVTLDRFVYNPNRGTGSVVLSATRGAFRFVSGSQNPVSYTIKTPAATIGVRGTVVQGQVGLTQSTFYVVEGAIVWKGITIPAGWAITVYADGTYHGPYKYDSASIPGWGNMGKLELPDSPNDLNDQLHGKDLSNQLPAPPQIQIGDSLRGGRK